MDNVVGTAHILDYARKLNNLERFAYFSTDEVLVLLRKELIIKKMIDIIQQIRIQLKGGAEELVVLLKILMDYHHSEYSYYERFWGKTEP